MVETLEDKWTLSTLPSLFSGREALSVIPVGEELSDAERFNNASRLIMYSSIGLYIGGGRQDTRPLVYGLLALAVMQSLGNGPEPTAGNNDEAPIPISYHAVAGSEPPDLDSRMHVVRRPPRPFAGRNSGRVGRFGIKPGVMDVVTRRIQKDAIGRDAKAAVDQTTGGTEEQTSGFTRESTEFFPDHRAKGFGAPGVPMQMLITRPGEAPRPNVFDQATVEAHLRFPGRSRPKGLTGRNPFAQDKAVQKKSRGRVAWDSR